MPHGDGDGDDTNYNIDEPTKQSARSGSETESTFPSGGAMTQNNIDKTSIEDDDVAERPPIEESNSKMEIPSTEVTTANGSASSTMSAKTESVAVAVEAANPTTMTNGDGETSSPRQILQDAAGRDVKSNKANNEEQEIDHDHHDDDDSNETSNCARTMPHPNLLAASSSSSSSDDRSSSNAEFNNDVDVILSYHHPPYKTIMFETFRKLGLNTSRQDDLRAASDVFDALRSNGKNAPRQFYKSINRRHRFTRVNHETALASELCTTPCMIRIISKCFCILTIMPLHRPQSSFYTIVANF